MGKSDFHSLVFAKKMSNNFFCFWESSSSHRKWPSGKGETNQTWERRRATRSESTRIVSLFHISLGGRESGSREEVDGDYGQGNGEEHGEVRSGVWFH